MGCPPAVFEMKQLLKELHAAGHKSFDLPIERLVVVLRVALTLFCLTALVAEPKFQSEYAAPFGAILATYALFGVGVALLPIIGKFRTGWQLPVHLIDIGVVSVLMYFVHQLTTTFFTLYVFLLLSATFRWNWRGALWTIALMLFLQIVMVWTHNLVPPSFAVQLPFVLIIGGMFVFFGVSRQQSAERLNQIAAWPKNEMPQYANTDIHWLDARLEHIARVFGVRRVLLVWEILQEPFCFEAYFVDGTCRQSRTILVTSANLVSAGLENAIFAVESANPSQCLTSQGIKQFREPAINESLQARFKVSSLCSAPFSGDFCKGRVFMLDRTDWRIEDLTLAEIVASHLHRELEFYAIYIQLKETAASRERIRLARDLHDGVLQTLAAAAMQLNLISSGSRQTLRQKLDKIQKLLICEQQRIRAFIEGRQQLIASQNQSLQDVMQNEIDRLKHQWSCDIFLLIIPPDAIISSELMYQVEFLVAEAVANAVQHGNASQIDIKIELEASHIRLQIADDGMGLKDLAGPYSHNELIAMGIGPQSISKRILELRGVLTLRSSSKGVNLFVKIPQESGTEEANNGHAAAFS